MLPHMSAQRAVRKDTTEDVILLGDKKGSITVRVRGGDVKKDEESVLSRTEEGSQIRPRHRSRGIQRGDMFREQKNGFV